MSPEPEKVIQLQDLEIEGLGPEELFSLSIKEKIERIKSNAEEEHELDPGDNLGQYLTEIGKVPLLTAQEEVSLSKRIERGRKASEEMTKGTGNSKRKDELRQFVEDGGAAREHLLTANTRLVVSVAKKYMGRGVPFLDMIQEGNIGLMRAAKKFEYRRGHKFSTYATWWIKQAVTRSIADQGRTIRVPVHIGNQINRLRRTRHQLTQNLGRYPTTEELAEALHVKREKVEDMIQIAQRPISLETPIDEDEEAVLGNFIGDESSPTLLETADENLLRDQIRDALHTLPPREALVLRLRFGLENGQFYTLEQAGRKMGITRERVRQIEASALDRLRHSSHKQKLIGYLEE